jgi:hypothetical protein
MCVFRVENTSTLIFTEALATTWPLIFAVCEKVPHSISSSAQFGFMDRHRSLHEPGFGNLTVCFHEVLFQRICE